MPRRSEHGYTPGAPTDLPTGASDVPARSLSSVDWLRSDRTPEAAAAALSTFGANRPYQMDHYEINQRWQELNIVLLGKEISNIFRPRIADLANPFDSPDELADNLEFLAGIEHVLVLEYLCRILASRHGQQGGANKRNPGNGATAQNDPMR